MKKRTFMVVVALSLAIFTAGVGFPAVTGGNSFSATKTNEQETYNCPQWGPSMMYGNNMPHAMYRGMMQGGWYEAMGTRIHDAGNGIRSMWDQCRRFLSGHDSTNDGATPGRPRS